MESAELGVNVFIADIGTEPPARSEERIFDPFLPAKAGEEPVVGFFICSVLIRQLGGRIELHSEPGTGTEFCLFFPFHIPDAVPVPSQSGKLSAPADRTPGRVVCARTPCPVRAGSISAGLSECIVSRGKERSPGIIRSAAWK